MNMVSQPNIVRALQDCENQKYKARQNTDPSIYNEPNYSQINIKPWATKVKISSKTQQKTETKTKQNKTQKQNKKQKTKQKQTPKQNKIKQNKTKNKTKQKHKITLLGVECKYKLKFSNFLIFVCFFFFFSPFWIFSMKNTNEYNRANYWLTGSWGSLIHGFWENTVKLKNFSSLKP